MTKKRRFGRVRQLASGRWQARYTGPDGIDRPAPETFATKTDAEVWLTLKEAEIRNGDWINPDDGARYCFSSGTSLEYFLDRPHYNIERARAGWRKLNGLH